MKIEPESVRVNGLIRKPSVIYVSEFSTTEGAWEMPVSAGDLGNMKAQASHDLYNAMLKVLADIAPTQAAPMPLPTSGLLVTGQFVHVNPGNRALRMGFGFGAGATHVETCVLIYDLAQSPSIPVATFITRGGSGSEPGFVAGGATSAVSGMSGLSADWGRTAKEVRDFLNKRMVD